MIAMSDASGALVAANVLGDPPPPLLEPLGSSCQKNYYETIYPFAMIQPKDFSFVLGGWTPSGSWVYHLFYIRQNQETKNHHGGVDFTEKNIGHARSNDLINWPMAQVDTAAVKVRSGLFDSKHVWAPNIVKRGLTYHMFYTGVASNNDQAIGLATSTDLVTWTQRTTPVLTASQLGAWAAPFGSNGAQLRDPFVMPDPAAPGSWLMYFVTIPANNPDAQIVGVARSNGDFTQWSNDFPLYSTLHLYQDAQNQTQRGDVESPTVFLYQGKWWLLYSVREIRPIWAIANATSPTDQVVANWSPTVDTNNLIVDEATGQPTNAYEYWHGAEFLQVNASQNIAFLAGWNDQSVSISYIPVRPAQSPFLFEEHCGDPTTGVGGDPRDGKSATLSYLGLRARGELRFRVDLPSALRVQLSIFDTRGRRVEVLSDGELPAGTSDFAWDGRTRAGVRAATGVYFAKLEGPGISCSARGVLIK